MNFSEPFFGYRFNGVMPPDGQQYVEGVHPQHDGKHVIDNDVELATFLRENVTEYPELRVTDGMDLLVLHIVRQKLIFPDPFPGTPNHWSIKQNRFVPYVD